jgi:beta-lactamase class A
MILQKKIPLHIAMLMSFAGIAMGCVILYSFQVNKTAEPASDSSLQVCTPEAKRLNGYAFIKPLLFTDKQCQAERLMPLKNEVSEVLNNYKLSGSIQSGSVYLRQLNQGDWITAGDDEKYYPGSLLKVPELITFLKMNEKAPGLLDKKIAYTEPLNLPKHAVYVSKSIEIGKTYSVKELLYYMIAYSDNNATMLLNQRMDMDIFKKVFTDLGLSQPDLTKNDIPLTPKEYSYFMRVLYNASYLNTEDSEFCTELLSHSDFVSGMINGLPKGTKVVHKFGEAGDGVNAHFSESGIIYIQNSPYLLTVMLKGKDNKVLPSVVSDISRKVFETISSI